MGWLSSNNRYSSNGGILTISGIGTTNLSHTITGKYEIRKDTNDNQIWTQILIDGTVVADWAFTAWLSSNNSYCGSGTRSVITT